MRGALNRSVGGALGGARGREVTGGNCADRFDVMLIGLGVRGVIGLWPSAPRVRSAQSCRYTHDVTKVLVVLAKCLDDVLDGAIEAEARFDCGALAPYVVMTDSKLNLADGAVMH